jgi:hypothetical protein
VLRHHHKSGKAEPIPIPHLFQNFKQKIKIVRPIQQRLPIATTPGDEVQRSGLVKAFQAPGHAPRIESWSLFVGDFDSSTDFPFPNAELLLKPHKKTVTLTSFPTSDSPQVGQV